MIINVGSRNSVKKEAVEEAFSEYFSNFIVNCFNVQSGVSEQPKSRQEGFIGARNRARNSFIDCDYSVGIENYVETLGFNNSLLHFNIAACSIYDGTKFSDGISPGFKIPHRIYQYMLAQGKTLDEALYDLEITENPRIGYSEGFVSLLTKDKITRKDYLKEGIEMALAELINPDIYKHGPGGI